MTLSSRRAFTLIELLLVIGLIAVLASLIMGVTNVVRSSSASAVCMANLRQIGMGMDLYASENNGWYPAHWSPTTDVTWYGAIAPYIITEYSSPSDSMSKLFHCPANRRPYNPKQDYYSDAGNHDQSYGYNQDRLSSNPGWKSSKKRQEIANRTQLVIVADIPGLGEADDVVEFPISTRPLYLHPAARLSSTLRNRAHRLSVSIIRRLPSRR